MTAITPIVAANGFAVPAQTFSHEAVRVNSNWKDAQENKAIAIRKLSAQLRAVWIDPANQFAFDAVDDYAAGFNERLAKLLEDEIPEAIGFYFGEAGL